MACCQNENLLDFCWEQLHEDAVAPEKDCGDVGWDLRCIDDGFQRVYSIDKSCYELPAGGRHVFHTGLAIELPDGYHGILKPRSGLAVKKGIDVLAGVIDNSYRGEIMICLQNNGAQTVRICAGDKIAQMIIIKECEGRFRRIASVSDTKRGDKGFGSTGR